MDTDVFASTSEQLWKGMAVSQRWLANFFMILSIAAITVPQHHDLRATYLDFRKSQQLWSEQACKLLDGTTAGAEPPSESEMLKEVTFRALEALRSLLLGDMEACWEAIGRSIRKGVTIHLFDHSECTPATREECARRSALARMILVTDRWMCFNRNRPFGIASHYVSLHGRETTTLDVRILRALEACHDFNTASTRLSLADRSERGLRLLQLIDTEFVGCLSDLRVDLNLTKGVPVGIFTSLDSSAVGQVASLVSSFLYMQCVFGMRFIGQNAAPYALRRCSIEGADSLIKTVPVL